jgi:NADPH:quinone reductase
MPTVSLPTTMIGIAIERPGGPEVLVPREMALPVAAPGEVLVRVVAAGVNRPDVLQRTGNYDPPPGASLVPGLEVAGTVVALGAGVADRAVGDRVCALLAGGGYAEYAAVPSAQCLPIPRGLNDVDAAAIPETFFTVWTNIFDRGRLTPGETLLVHGGASGIGTTTIQLASALGSRVFATAGGAAKCRACEALGAERCIDYRTEDFVAVIKAATAGAGVDVVADIVGGDYVARNLELLRLDGRLVQIGMLGGVQAQVKFGPILQKRLWVTGSTLRPRSIAEKGELARAVYEHVWPLLEAGRVKPVIDRTFPLVQAADAHRRMESSEHVGKIVLVV